MKSLRISKSLLEKSCQRAEHLTNQSNPAVVSNALNSIRSEFEQYRRLFEENSETNSDLDEDFFILEQLVSETCDHLLSLTVEHNSASAPGDSNDDLQKTIAALFTQQTRALQSLAIKSESSNNHLFSSLPKLQIGKFSGKYDEWTSFRDLYVSSIHTIASLTDVQKFQHLKALLTGEAEALIRSIPLTDANYAKAWALVTEKYDHPYFIIRSLIDNLHSCESVSQNCGRLKTLTNTLVQTIQCLDNLGDYARQRDPWVLHTVLGKLDLESKQAWARENSNVCTPTVSDLVQFLENRCRAFELVQSKSDSHKKFSESTKLHPSEFQQKKAHGLKLNATISNQTVCFCCSDDHLIFRCVKFNSLSVLDRDRLVRSQGRCFNCLNKGHSVKDCKSSYSCSKCKRRHHTLLHSSDEKKPDGNENSDKSLSSPEHPILSINTFGSCSTALLPTATVQTADFRGEKVSIRALLDSGSQSNFISERMFHILGFPRNQVRVPISSFSSNQCQYSKGQITIVVSSEKSPEHQITINAHILSRMIDRYPNEDLPVSHLDILEKECPLADANFNIASPVDLILSGAIFLEILKPGKFIHQYDKLIIHNTIFGHIVCSHDDTSRGMVFSNHLALPSDTESADVLLEKFWAVEEPPSIRTTVSNTDSLCEIFYQSTTQRAVSGRFSVKLPFSSAPHFGDSYQTAFRRLKSLERKFEHLPDFREEYRKFMSDYQTMGHMTPLNVSLTGIEPVNHYFIPHHGIWQNGGISKKLRVVFDASAKTTNGKSLNDQLHSGPILQANLPSIIMKFRLFRYVMSTDIEKMYRQILVDENDRWYQLILWRDSPSDPIKTFQLNTVTYGEACSPFLAIRTLHELANREKQTHPNAAEVLLKGTYVDDIFFGDNDLQRVELVRDELIQLMKLGGFSLRKWMANERSLLSQFPNSDLASPLIFTDDAEVSVKMLGLIWNPLDDSFRYKFIQSDLDKYTKRALLSDTARLFDPMGWISPVVLTLKILFQETWVRKIAWDEPLPSDIVDSWLKTRAQLSTLSMLNIPRWVSTEKFELHGFADASTQAYCAAVYSRSIMPNGKISVNLLIAKTKLAPLKQISVPRLELCAAHLLARLILSVKTHIGDHVNKVILWSDSTTVLAWLQSMPRKWSSFVGNRITHILELCPQIEWHHVSTKCNPADIGSRGTTPDLLGRSELWWQGPQFLQSPDFTPPPFREHSTDVEASKRKLLNVVVESPFWITVMDRFSSFNRLIHTMSYIIRFKNAIRSKMKNIHYGPLTADENKFALQFLIRKIQEHFYSTELSALESHSAISSSSPLSKFTPFQDDQGLLRVGGRLGQVDLPRFNAHPILLPMCTFTRLLILKTHLENFHGGFSLVLSQIRQTFWVPGIRPTIQSTIRRCPQCIRYHSRALEPLMGELPSTRTNPAKPFQVTGIDFAGPFTIRPWKSRGKVSAKGYIAVFICAGTKAIHLELVMGLDAKSLIMAIQRFLARRGRCDQFLSDNGRNFTSCGKLFKELRSYISTIVNDDDLKNFLSNQYIGWKYIPPYSPNFGGLWEAAVKTVKKHLFHAFHSKSITVEDFSTFLCQIENIVNSRPLIPISLTSPDMPLTPNMLLLKSPSSLPLQLDLSKCSTEGNSSSSDPVAHFWKRWKNDYLDTLISRTKWKRKEKNLAVGDLVIIRRRTEFPSFWLMGRVIDVFPGADGIIRVASVRTKNGLRKESCRNLILLNVEDGSSTGGTMLGHDQSAVENG